MLALEDIAGRRGITTVRIDDKVFIRQAEISLVGDLLGVPGFETQALLKRGSGVAVEACFEDVVLQLVAGAQTGMIVDLLESATLALHGL